MNIHNTDPTLMPRLIDFLDVMIEFVDSVLIVLDFALELCGLILRRLKLGCYLIALQYRAVSLVHH